MACCFSSPGSSIGDLPHTRLQIGYLLHVCLLLPWLGSGGKKRLDGYLDTVAISGAVEISQEHHNHKKLNFWTGIDLKTHAKLQHLAQIAIPVPAKTLILSSRPSILPVRRISSRACSSRRTLRTRSFQTERISHSDSFHAPLPPVA